MLKNLEARGPASLEVCALLRKPDAVKVDVSVRYVVSTSRTSSSSGYGLDYAEALPGPAVHRTWTPRLRLSRIGGRTVRTKREARPDIRRASRFSERCSSGFG